MLVKDRLRNTDLPMEWTQDGQTERRSASLYAA